MSRYNRERRQLRAAASQQQQTARSQCECQLCRRRCRIPADVSSAIAAGTVALSAYVCARCAATEAGRAILHDWPAADAANDKETP